MRPIFRELKVWSLTRVREILRHSMMLGRSAAGQDLLLMERGTDYLLTRCTLPAMSVCCFDAARESQDWRSSAWLSTLLSGLGKLSRPQARVKSNLFPNIHGRQTSARQVVDLRGFSSQRMPLKSTRIGRDDRRTFPVTHGLNQKNTSLTLASEGVICCTIR